jgi:hypothetical protein
VNGNEKELVLTGSVVLGWFAAVAEVLYDLEVAIFSSDGQVISGTKSGANPQLRIIYREEPYVPLTFNQSWLSSLFGSSRRLCGINTLAQSE